MEVFLFLVAAAAFLIAAAAIACALWQTLRLKAAAKELRAYRDRFAPVFDVDDYVDQQEYRLRELGEEQSRITRSIDQCAEELALIEEALSLKADDARLLDVGYYEPVYGFEGLSDYENAYQSIKEKQKEMLRLPGEALEREAAAYATQPFAVNGSDTQGRAFLRDLLGLMLRAFNGECDAFIARVNYKNIEMMKRRIRSSYEQVNRLSQRWACELSAQYLGNRMQELSLVFEWEEAKQREKEEQSRIKEQIREEEKAAREAEKAKQQADRDESKFQDLLKKAEEQAASASENDKARLAAKIKELQDRISEIEDRKHAISQAMLTKAGHVYIISNVGSFGENVYKIGMTRRLEPMDRVKELGDASVPFPFDVHAMIRTNDAPSLENALHNHFASRRVNLENERKEFFRVTIDEIQQELLHLRDDLGIETELRLTLLAEAKEYRLSEAKRRHVEQAQNPSV